jgi:hypothetical protein
MKKKYVIEKNIPVLSIQNWGRWSQLASRMEDGDSVLCTKKEAGALRMSIYSCKGFKPIMRKVRDTETGEFTGEYRIWKLKKEV